MQLTPLGDGAILVGFRAKTEIAALEKATGIARALGDASLPGVTDIVPAYATITVHYDPMQVPAGAGSPSDRMMALIDEAAAAASTRKNKGGREVIVPVCYGGEQGPDLAEVAKHAKLTEAEVIKLHSTASYRVAALGFSPGFPYLLGLPEKLHMPRRATPRTRSPGRRGALLRPARQRRARSHRDRPRPDRRRDRAYYCRRICIDSRRSHHNGACGLFANQKVKKGNYKYGSISKTRNLKVHQGSSTSC